MADEENLVWSNLVTDGSPSILFVARRFGGGGEGAVVQPGALKVAEIDLLPKQNAASHYTKRFEMVHRGDPPTTVVRRGEPFTLTIRFNERIYSPENDILRLIFDFGTNPIVIKGTKGIITIDQSTEDCWPDRSGLWDARIQPITSDKDPVTIEVRSPADVPVGEWSLQVETMVKSESANGVPLVYTHPHKMFILFNPWLKEDSVYMEDKRLLDEYVLNDTGKIWVGTHREARGRHWVFGQFDRNVLPAAMLILERAHLVPKNYGDPIVVSRAISKLVNSNDDQGVLRGRWDGSYKDGTSPSAWTGSVEILKKYHRTKLEVNYGQCWVFAGVVTTVCRALGIPSRVVSNLVSAHDANASFTIDKYYTQKGDELEFDPMNEAGEDSVWNFHVWNEVWMARPDLPKGYGGWQAIDATPQETSDGVFQCGPAPIEAIKKGIVAYKYDVPFVLSSVNADLIRWQEDPSSSIGYRKMETNTLHIGRQLLTKQPFVFDPYGDTDKEDITKNYKEKEGSQMERTAMYNAARGLVSAKRFFFQPGESEDELSFQLVDLERVPIGESFTIVVNITNNLDKLRKMDVVLSASSVYYNGINAHLIKKASGTFQIKPNSKEQLRLVVSSNDYLEKLVEYCMMKIFAVVTVLDTKQTWAGEDDFQVIKPPLDIKIPDRVVVGEPGTVEFSFKNPLNKTLQKCKLRFESSPVLTKVVVMDYEDVGPLQEMRVQGTVTPRKAGKFTIVGVFSSRELIDITGAAVVEVLPAATQ